MEIGEILSFEHMNQIVLETMSVTLEGRGISPEVEHVGLWYYRFRCSDWRKGTLRVPFYNSLFRDELAHYLYLLDLLFKLSSRPQEQVYDQVELFDYFSYENSGEYDRTKRDFYIPIKNGSGEILEFQQQIHLRQDRFIPLFRSGTVTGNEKSIFRAFDLLRVIAQGNWIPRPVLIDLEADFSVLISTNLVWEPVGIQLEHIRCLAFRNHDERSDLLTRVMGKGLVSSIIFRYPYHSGIDSVISKAVSRKSRSFDVSLSGRLFYDDIEDMDVVLLPNDLNDTVFDTDVLIDLYQVVPTGHSGELYDALQLLRTYWNEHGLNIFQNPFPVKWLMFIHGQESLEFWLTSFRRDFPMVTGVLLHKANEVIALVYGVDWLGNFLKKGDDLAAVVPKMSQYPELEQSAISFLKPFYMDVSKPQEISAAMGEQILLNPFNTVLLANMLCNRSLSKARVLVPDFLYFCYQPFMLYLIAKYCYDPLLAEGRAKIDPDYPLHKANWEEFRKIILTNSKDALLSYRKKYTPEEEITPEPIFGASLESDMEISEIAERNASRTSTITASYIKVDTTIGMNFVLTTNEPVLVRYFGQIVQMRAREVQLGFNFLPLRELSNSIDVVNLSDKLSQISERAVAWKKGLLDANNQVPNLYRSLKARGLSILEQTFNKDYMSEMVENVNFSLPRSRNDWQIVGEYLDLPDIARAWVNRKRSTNIVLLKQAYLKVIHRIFLHYQSDGQEENTLLDDLEQMINEVAAENGPDSEVKREDVLAIVDSINENLIFYEIDNINLNDE